VSRAEQAIELAIAVGIGVAIRIMAMQGAWKKLKKGLRRTHLSGRRSGRHRAERVAAAAEYCRPVSG